jgi:glycosyltransferase involved in cell wall biosynthesis
VINRLTTRLANHPPYYFTPALLGRSLSREIRAAHIVHTVGYYFFGSTFGHLAANLFGLPHVSTPVYTLNPSSWQRELFDAALGRSIVARARHVLPQSPHEVELLRQARFKLPAHTVIPFGVDTTLFENDYDVSDLKHRHAIADDERVLLFVGKIMSPKGAFDCLEVAARLRRAGRRIRLVLIGDVHDNELEPFTRRVTELRLHDCIVQTGALSDRREIARYYQLADVVLFPSQYEQFGIVAVEAVGSGRPLVSTPVGLMQTLVPQLEVGLLHPFGDLDRFERDLIEVLDDPRYRDNAQRQRQEILRHYSWRCIASQTAQVYAAVTGQRL